MLEFQVRGQGKEEDFFDESASKCPPDPRHLRASARNKNNTVYKVQIVEVEASSWVVFHCEIRTLENQDICL